jgi:EmrB/QacA subfamily drug resistance transporter
VVNVALRTIGADLGASLEQLQWVVNGYMLALAGLVLVGGSLSDRLGRRRIYVVGVAWFLIGSLLCAVAQTPGQLIGTRVLQGIGAALLTPGALAIIQASFAPGDRAPAIGTWAGMSGTAAALGPFVGGWLVDHASWRWIFGINVPLCLVVLALVVWVTPESRSPRTGRFDIVGAFLTVVALAGLTFALTSPAAGPISYAAGLVAVVAAVAFMWVERRAVPPLVPLSLFGSRVFSAANAMTFVVYGALGVVFFVLVLQLQVSAGWSALAAGLSGLPVTVALMLLSSRAAALSARIGPRIPMSLGPIVCAAGCLLLVPVGAGAGWLTVLPGMVVFALGLALLVSPLTATVLAAAPDSHSGVASGINNAVARAGSLLAVAALPALVGLSGRRLRAGRADDLGIPLGDAHLRGPAGPRRDHQLGRSAEFASLIAAAANRATARCQRPGRSEHGVQVASTSVGGRRGLRGRSSSAAYRCGLTAGSVIRSLRLWTSRKRSPGRGRRRDRSVSIQGPSAATATTSGSSARWSTTRPPRECPTRTIGTPGWAISRMGDVERPARVGQGRLAVTVPAEEAVLESDARARTSPPVARMRSGANGRPSAAPDSSSTARSQGSALGRRPRGRSEGAAPVVGAVVEPCARRP